MSSALWYANAQAEIIHNDAPGAVTFETKPDKLAKNSLEDEDLSLLVWGSNKNHVLGDDVPESVRVPTDAAWFKNVALRDLVLHEQHAACVDARGDVYQWGDGFFGSTPGQSHARPELTLKGKDITQLQLTRSRTFALSSSGRIYVLSSRKAEQELPGKAPNTSGSSWTGWLWGETQHVDFAEIIPAEKLKRGERFVHISAGTDHLLALTSDGRTFAHPISLDANSHGQLGFRKCDIPAPADVRDHTGTHPRVRLELTPKSIADPYAKASPAVRASGAPGARLREAFVGPEAAAAGVDDASIRWSDRLFEVPALRGVAVERAVAGARSSFVKTASGRVLGWGANENGQIGLGGNVTLQTIAVPTEVILWKMVPAATKTKCLDVFAGGDLTIFAVERSDGTSIPAVDILACGNGQYGALGNAQYSNAQSSPVRAKEVSGLVEYNEATKGLEAIVPDAISISPTGHVLLTLDTRTRAGPGGGRRDVVAWGANFEYQLGTGKRGSVAVPTVIPTQDGGRFMLQTRRAGEVRDMQGRVWKKGVEVEQRAVAGWNTSVVYWRIR